MAGQFHIIFIVAQLYREYYCCLHAFCLQRTWDALCGRYPSAADEPDTTGGGNALIISKEIRETWLAIREACAVAEAFWDFVFEQADHGHLPGDIIQKVDGRTLMKRRWVRRASNFRKLVEPLAMANLAYMNVDADYSTCRPGRFARIENMRELNAKAVPVPNV